MFGACDSVLMFICRVLFVVAEINSMIQLLSESFGDDAVVVQAK